MIPPVSLAALLGPVAGLALIASALVLVVLLMGLIAEPTRRRRVAHPTVSEAGAAHRTPRRARAA
jgi:hypothetical protein